MHETVKDLSSAALASSKKAVQVAKGHDVAITYLSGSKIVKERADGSKETIGTIARSTAPTRRRFKL